MIKLALKVLEDILPADLVEDWELGRAYAPDTLLSYWGAALSRLQETSWFTNPKLNPELLGQGYGREPITIEVLLCSRTSLDALTSCEGALGVHQISVPDNDPFNEESASARAYRVLMVSDKDEFLSLTKSLADEDINPQNYLDEYLAAYINTMFHEIAHALLFAENAALMSPADIEALSDAGELDHDIFDCSTGYGIRALEIDGTDISADDMEQAEELMEIYVEALGRRMMHKVLKDDEAIHHFPRAMRLEAEINRLIETP